MMNHFFKRLAAAASLSFIMLGLCACDPVSQYEKALEDDNFSKAESLVQEGLSVSEYIITYKDGNEVILPVINLTIAKRLDNADQYLELFIDQDLTAGELSAMTSVFYKKARFELIEKLYEKHESTTKYLQFNGRIDQVAQHPEFASHYKFLLDRQKIKPEILLDALGRALGDTTGKISVQKIADLYIKHHGLEWRRKFDKHVLALCKRPEWRQLLLSSIASGKLDLSLTPYASSVLLKNISSQAEMMKAISSGVRFDENLLNVGRIDPIRSITPIYWIAKKYDIKTAMAAFEAGAVKIRQVTPHTLTSLGFDPFLLAKHGIDLDLENGRPIRTAETQDKYDYMHQLVEAGANPMLLDGWDLFAQRAKERVSFTKKIQPVLKERLNTAHQSFLMDAISGGDAQTIELMMTCGIMPDDKHLKRVVESGRKDKLPMILAMARHYPARVFLNNYGIDFTFQIEDDACRQLLFKHLSKMPPHPAWMSTAASYGRITAVKKLLDAGVDPNCGYRKSAPLVGAFGKKGSIRMQNLLLDHGADLFYRYDWDGSMPIQKINAGDLQKLLPPMLARSRKILGDQSSELVAFARKAAKSSRYKKTPLSKICFDYNPKSKEIRDFHGVE